MQKTYKLYIRKEFTERDVPFSQTGIQTQCQNKVIIVDGENTDFDDENLRFSGYLYNCKGDMIGIIISCNQADMFHEGWIDYALMPKQEVTFTNGDAFMVNQEHYAVYMECVSGSAESVHHLFGSQ